MSGVVYGVAGGAADSGVSDASFSAAVGLFDKAKAALECNVCKVIAEKHGSWNTTVSYPSRFGFDHVRAYL